MGRSVMKPVQFKKGVFIKTAMKKAQYPKSGALPEISLVGRSNVGKSTLLNHLLGTKKLVKTSGTPGKTQALNFFSVDNALLVADLPGYGFAKVPASIRRKWGPMVQEYLDERNALKVVLFLLDIRRMPNKDDLQFIDWAVHGERSILLVLTKTDKVKQNELHRNTKKILDAFGLKNLHYVHYSSTKNKGRQELITMINQALEDESD